MAFPYLIKVVSDGPPPILTDVIVVRGETEWKRYFLNGNSESSFDLAKQYRSVFAKKQRALDNLRTGMSPVTVDFKEDASDTDIKTALEELKDAKTRK